MKNFYGLIVLSLFSVFATGIEVEFGGHHRVRGVYFQQNIEEMFIQRFKFSGMFRANEMFASTFWLMSNYNWGDENYNNNEIRIYGYGDWRISDEVMVRVGRTPYQISDGSFVGMNNYSAYPYVMDGVFLTYNTESLFVDVFAAYLPKVWDGASEYKKYIKIAGISLDVQSLPEAFKMANLFAIYSLTSRKKNNDQVRVGLGIGGDSFGIDYKLTASMHGINIENLIDEYVVDTQLGYLFKDYNTRVYLGGHYETKSYDSFFYTRHPRAGLLDVAQWGKGTTYGEAGVSYKHDKNCEIGIIGLYFDSVGSWGQWSSNSEEGEDNKDNKETKSLRAKKVIEADIYLKKYYVGGFSINLQGGLFDITNKNSYWQVQLNTKFDF